MRLVHLTGGTVALAIWRLVDDTIVPVHLNQGDYDSFVAGGGRGDPPGRPADDASPLVSSGGIPALDTDDGFPLVGDCWEVDVLDEDGNPTGDRQLCIAQAPEPEWSYSYRQASDPGKGKMSRVEGFAVEHTDARMTLDDYDEAAPAATDVAVGASSIQAIVIDQTEPNHRSVTFDAQASGSISTGNPLTVSGTIAANANRYVAGLLSGDDLSATSVTWNGTALAPRASSAGNAGADYWDLVAPASGAHNMVFTQAAPANRAIVGGFVSAYGVDQTSPCDTTNSSFDNSFTNTAPSLTLTGGTSGGLSIVLVAWRALSTSPTDAIDVAWVSDFNVGQMSGDGIHFAGAAVAHKTAASTLTRTDTLSAAVAQWGCVGACLKAAASPKSGFFVFF